MGTAITGRLNDPYVSSSRPRVKKPVPVSVELPLFTEAG